MSSTTAGVERKGVSGPLECKSKLDGVLTRATAELHTLLSQQLSRLQSEYEAIRAAHFPCVPPPLQPLLAEPMPPMCARPVEGAAAAAPSVQPLFVSPRPEREPQPSLARRPRQPPNPPLLFFPLLDPTCHSERTLTFGPRGGEGSGSGSGSGSGGAEAAAAAAAPSAPSAAAAPAAVPPSTATDMPPPAAKATRGRKRKSDGEAKVSGSPKAHSPPLCSRCSQGMGLVPNTPHLLTPTSLPHPTHTFILQPTTSRLWLLPLS